MNHFRATSRAISRRDFVRSAAAGMCGLAVLPSIAAPQKRAVVIGVLLPSDLKEPRAQSLVRGVLLGIDEATRASSLFSQPVRFVHGSYASAAAISASVSEMKSAGVDVIVGGSSEDACKMLGDTCTSAGVVYLDVACRSDSLRRSSCSPFVFHVEASDAMYTAAGASSPGAQVVLWHPSLTRYGASQLNDRYRAQFGEAMNGPAWAAWVAVKIAWETGLRSQAAGPPAIAAALAADSTQFDGHKGAPLSFRSWDHQLRQPLYAVMNASGKESVTDVPDLARSSRPARELLDGLGDRASDHACTVKPS